LTTQWLETIELEGGLEDLLERWHEPGAAEVCELLWRMLGGGARRSTSDQSMHLERLKREVYRLRVGGAPGHTLVLKRLSPSVAQTDRLVAVRWLPAIGLGDRCPRLLGVAAQRAGQWVWHVYEDLGGEHLGGRREPERVEAAVDLLVELHARGANNRILPEVRWRAGDLGAHFFTANLRDALTALEAVTPFRGEGGEQFAASRSRLLDHLSRLLEDAPRRVRIMAEAGRPHTLLHGDLWPKNVFVSMAGETPRACLIDWDHVGAGPCTYDLSTFLYRSDPEERPWILQRYREGMARAGWPLAGNEELNLLFHTAEAARCAHCILFDAMAVLNEGARWGIEELMEYERWLEALRPPLPD
jgi:aminoglycoside phosphotransferase (APT) family kinase protein